jgi:hypothetical protein
LEEKTQDFFRARDFICTKRGFLSVEVSPETETVSETVPARRFPIALKSAQSGAREAAEVA